MPKTFSCTLSNIASLRDEIQDYTNLLQIKCMQFVNEMESLGISIASMNVGNYGRFITFSKKVDPVTDGCRGLFVATQTGVITSSWITKENGKEVVKQADVSPLLMCEFGSGMYASNPLGVAGGGRGTFPSPTAMEHAKDPSGWWFMDMNHNWIHTYGQTPNAPMYKALIDMQANISALSKRIFNG